MRNRPLSQLAAAACLLVAVLGFIPGITNYSALSFAGQDSEAKLLGLFADNVLHLFLGVATIGLGVVLGQQATHKPLSAANAS